MNTLRLDHPGEQALARNLRKSRADAKRAARRQRLGRWWRKLLGEKPTEASETFDKLKTDLAEARYRMGQAEETLVNVTHERDALKAQVKSLLAQIDPSDLGETSAKAKAFDALAADLGALSQWADSLEGLERRLLMRKVLTELRSEMKTARDGFQKIKLYRKYLTRFFEFPELREVLEPFRQDRERIKNREQVEAFLESLRALTEVEGQVERLVASGGDVLSRVRKTLAPWQHPEART